MTATHCSESPLSSQERGLGGEAREQVARIFQDEFPSLAGVLDDLLAAGVPSEALIHRIEARATDCTRLVASTAAVYTEARAKDLIPPISHRR